LLAAVVMGSVVAGFLVAVCYSDLLPAVAARISKLCKTHGEIVLFKHKFPRRSLYCSVMLWFNKKLLNNRTVCTTIFIL
jgi:hypothetical protein